MDTLAVIVIIIVAVIIGAMFIGRTVRRSAAKAGDRYGRRATAERTGAILEGLGRTLVIHAAEPAVREIVDGVVVAQPRRFSLLGDGGYGIRFIEADDAVVRLAGDADGTRMQLERSVERLGMPQNLEFWNDLRSQVASGAESRGIRVTDGPWNSFDRAGADPAVWTMSAGG